MDEVATSVAATLTALGEQVAEPSSTPLPDILPHSLYFLSDRSGTTQIWQLDLTGTNIAQISFHESSILDFHADHNTGALAYTTGTELVYINADGERQTWQVEDADTLTGLPEIAGQISSPKLSSDGLWLAYAQNGLRLIDLKTGISQLMIPNEWEQSDNESIYPGRLYSPESWSPNNARMLISIAYIEAGTLAFFELASRSIIDFIAPGIVCCHSAWAADSESVFLASPYIGLIDSGLWRYSAEDGEEEILIASSLEDGTVKLVGWPMADGDGNLNFFYAETAGIPQGNTPLLMVNAEIGQWADPYSLREDGFHIQDALWAPDGSLAIILPNLEGQSGPLILANEDGRSLQVLIDDAWNPQWGP